MRLLYIANIRVPSEKAHTFQIMRMCAAFASAGAEVTLIVPKRANPLRDDPFTFYGLPRNFSVVTVPTWDTIGRRFLPGHLALGFALVSFLFSVRRYARLHGPYAVWYTRELWLLPFLRGRHLLAYEAHDVPGGGAGLYRRAVRYPGVVTATSDALARELVACGVPSERLGVERNGVDVDRHALSTREDARRFLGLGSEPLILYAGQLHAWKGIPTLLSASRLLPEGNQIMLVGGLPDEIARWRQAVPDARAAFVGQRPHKEIVQWLAAADVCLVPTSGKTREGRHFTSPIKLFEALRAGCPIVASDVPAIREIVDERVALLVPPDDPEVLVSGITAVLSDPAAALERAAHGQARVRDWSWDERALRILRRLIS